MMVGSQTSFSIENGDGSTFLTLGLMPFIRVYLYSKNSTHLFAEQMIGAVGIHATAREFELAFLACSASSLSLSAIRFLALSSFSFCLKASFFFSH